jgi:cytidyltransferase-like protein
VIRVYVDMVADLFHYGHIEFLRQARELGDFLIVGVHSDATAAAYKREPILTMDERIRVVEACRYVDEVVADAPLIIDEPWIRKHRIDLVAHGDDMDEPTMRSFYALSEALGILRVVRYTRSISTSEIIRRIEERGEAGRTRSKRPS